MARDHIEMRTQNAIICNLRLVARANIILKVSKPGEYDDLNYSSRVPYMLHIGLLHPRNPLVRITRINTNAKRFVDEFWAVNNGEIRTCEVIANNSPDH